MTKLCNIIAMFLLSFTAVGSHASKIYDEDFKNDAVKRVNNLSDETIDDTISDEIKNLNVSQKLSGESLYKEAEDYFNGTNNKKNSFSKAFTLYLQAAILNYHRAAMDVGMLYEGGLGCEKSLKKALHWYKIAEKAAVKDATAKRIRVEEKLNSRCLIF